MSTTSQWTNEQIQDIIADSACCLATKNAQRIQATWNGEDVECLTNETLMLAEYIDSLGRFTAVGTILYYNNSVCASIDMTDFFSLLTDNQRIIITVQASSGDVVIVDFTGDFSTLTLSEFIDELVAQIAIYGRGYAATNADPNITICFTGTSQINLVGTLVSISIGEFYYLRYRANNARKSAMTALGYGAILQRRPVFIGTLSDGTTAVNKLYVPNGDRVDFIFPSPNVPPAGATASKITLSFTGAIGGGEGVGTHYTTNIAPGLTNNFFTHGQEFIFSCSVTDVNKATNCGGSTLASPLAPYVNNYVVRCFITAYDDVTGDLDYDIINWSWQGNTSITAFYANTQAYVATCGANPPAPYGTLGGTAIGAQQWTFQPQLLGWGTVSIYDCDLITGALTWTQDLEINIGNSTESCLNQNNNMVYISGTGNNAIPNNMGGVVEIDPTTDTPIGVLNLHTTNLGIKWMGALKGNEYPYSIPYLQKVGSNLQYDPLTPFGTGKSVLPVSGTVGCIAFDSAENAYIASFRNMPLKVYYVVTVPSPDLTADGTPILLFTALDSSILVPSNADICPTDFNSLGTLTGLTNLQLNIGTMLDVYNLIWVAGASFILSYTDTSVFPNIRYNIVCTIQSYDNLTGLLIYTIASVNSVNMITLVVTTITSFPLAGNYCWTWAFYPFFSGAIDMWYHEATQKLYITRSTNIGALLQSYDVGFIGSTPTIDPLTRINYYPPGYPTTTLSGFINYQSIEDKFFIPNSSGATVYIFDPNTQTWDSRPITHTPPPTIGGDNTTVGGIQVMSYTADETLRATTGINMYGSTFATNEVSSMTHQEPQNYNQFGVFVGSAVAVLSTSAQNCLDNPDNLITNIKQACGCCNREEGTVPSENVQLVLAANGGNGLSANGGYIIIIP